MSEDLKPCPFCGSTNLGSGGDDKIVGVWCRSCQANGPNHYGSREWNDRVPDAALLAERDALREALEWYAEKVAGCRLVRSGGDHRYALADDGGKRARAALTGSSKGGK